jgi:hypothetical protein
MRAKYDVIGINYAELRKPDRRIARVIESALGSAQSVLNVGAGTGSLNRNVCLLRSSGLVLDNRNCKQPRLKRLHFDG